MLRDAANSPARSTISNSRKLETWGIQKNLNVWENYKASGEQEQKKRDREAQLACGQDAMQRQNGRNDVNNK